MSPEVELTQLMKQLDGAPSVVWSTPSFHYGGDNPRELVPDDPSFGNQYHHQVDTMNNEQAWDITTGDPSIIVAVTDDGIDRTHDDLSPNIWNNPGEVAGNGADDDGNGYVDDVQGWDFVNSNNNPNPNSGGDDHGTHVAGIAGGRLGNSVGISGTAGTATIMPIQFYQSGRPWTGPTIRESFEYAVDNGARIVTTSYNINGWVGDANFTAGLQYIHDAGALHFNSAGNGSELNPARQAFEQTLLVASTDDGDRLSSFTNYGTGIDIAAPGGDILSTIPGNNYGFKGGPAWRRPTPQELPP